MEWYRGDAGDLKRSELDELVEHLTCLNAPEGKNWKIDQMIVMDDRTNQKLLMDEELVQNSLIRMNRGWWSEFQAEIHSL